MKIEPLPFADAIPEDVRSDLEQIANAVASGEKPDPEVVRRVRERADRSREAIFQRNGLLDIAVPSIRELRDACSSPTSKHSSHSSESFRASDSLRF